jgi:putative SOS response-associated peptidase YedK
MCGRFVRHSSLRLIEQTFNVDATEIQSASSYNIAPGQQVLAIMGGDDHRLAELHWGLVPFWAQDKRIGNRLINARSETVAEKPSFRTAFAKRRCLIVADGFYEWKGAKGDKQPFYFALPDGSPFGFAGLWEVWKGGDASSETYLSCAIITTEASESVSAIHHRMPVILHPEKHASWLESSPRDTDSLKQLLAGGHIRQLVHHPVSRRVNSSRNNEPACIDPI